MKVTYKMIDQKNQNKVARIGTAVHKKGIFFKVWAPHAEQVSVVGDFNDWKEGANTLVS